MPRCRPALAASTFVLMRRPTYNHLPAVHATPVNPLRVSGHPLYRAVQGGHEGCSVSAVRRDHVLRAAAVGLVLYGLFGFALLLLGFAIAWQTFAQIDQLRGALS